MQVLIVEDSREMRRMIRSLVAAFADEIFECEDGGEGVSVYRAHRPDWVLMDIRLKETDGIEATRQICASDPKARVVMVTSYDDTELRAEATLAGAIGYVTKDNLLELREILSQPLV